MNHLRQTAKRLLTAILPPRMLLAHGPRHRNGIALTFDDGPHPEYTPRLLDELHRHGITATFFVVGRQADKYPEIVRRIAAEGHTLGNHSYTHSEPSSTSAADLVKEVIRARQVLEDLTGEPVHFFRPPKGELTLRKMWGLWRLDQTIALWNVDPKDYALNSVESLLPWCAGYQPAGGDIILLHDTHPHCIGAIESLASQAALDSLLTFQSLNDWISHVPDGRLDPKPIER